MGVSFSALETRVDQMIDVCRSLREENQALRSRVAQLEKEKSSIEDRMASACTRLEALMDRLPEE